MTFESQSLRIGLVVEGPTDYLMLEAVINRLLSGRSATFTYMQPEYSFAFEPIGTEGGGWPGVYRWCRSTAELNGQEGLGDNILFLNHDVLIVQVDADVARNSYADGHIIDDMQDLPCVSPCPPVVDTVEALKRVVLRWLDATACPPQVVICIPSQSLEAWILSGLYPTDRLVQSGVIECRAAPERLLSSKPKDGRLVSGGKKNIDVYQMRASEFADSWQLVKQFCSLAAKFEQEFLTVFN